MNYDERNNKISNGKALSLIHIWQKLHPCDVLEAGEVKTLVDTDGPGIIRSMWFTGDVSQSLVLRIYWDGQEHPSVEAPLGSFFGYGFPDITSDRDNRFPTLNSAMLLDVYKRQFQYSHTSPQADKTYNQRSPAPPSDRLFRQKRRISE